MAFDNRHRGADDADLEPVRHHARLASPRVKRVSTENYDAHARQPPLLPQRCLRGSSGCGVGASSWSSTDCTVKRFGQPCGGAASSVPVSFRRRQPPYGPWWPHARQLGPRRLWSGGSLARRHDESAYRQSARAKDEGEAAQALEALGSPADLLAAAIGDGVVTARDRAAPMWRWTLCEGVH